MRVLAVILARGGSTRIPGKNLAKLGGLALVKHAAFAARDASLITETVISTDDPNIAAEVEDLGIRWIKRPEALSGADARIEDALRHALETSETKAGEPFDYVVALQAAVPLRPPGAIDALINRVSELNARGGVTVVKRSPWIWSTQESRAETWWNPRHGYPRSQDVRREHFEEVNAIQVTPRAECLAGQRWASPVCLLELPRWADHDIDVPEDLEEANADWPAIYERAFSPFYRWHLVAHPQVPKIACPIVPGMGRNRFGVVFGNGPQLDTLPDSFFRQIEGPAFLSIGVKRAVCSKRFALAGFAPDLSLQWDAPARGAQLDESIRVGLDRLKGRTWRLNSSEHDMAYFPHDQVLRNAPGASGSTSHVRLWSVVTDAACNVLYRMGVRELFLYGVELNGPDHCAILPEPERYAEPHDLSRAEARDRFVNDWKKFKAEHPDLKVWCAAKDSRLVREGVFEYREVSP